MKVIIAIDESPYSKKVLETLAERKWPFETSFKIMSVVEPVESNADDHPDWNALVKGASNRRMKAANKICAEGMKILKQAHPDSNIHIDIREGNPRHEIVDAAVEWMADKILIGAHGKDLCDRFVWGGVSRVVAVKSPCSVEIVRPRIKHSQDARAPKLDKLTSAAS